MLSGANVIFIEGETAMTGLEALKSAQYITIKGNGSLCSARKTGTRLLNGLKIWRM